jgi:hypothetical protein
MILRPRTLNIVLLALLLIPLWGAGLWDILRFGELLAGFGLIGLAVLIWVPGIAGVRVVAGNDHVEMYRLFWRVWKVGISHLVIRRDSEETCRSFQRLFYNKKERGTRRDIW